MKTKFVWSILALVMTLLPLCPAHASLLDDLAGNGSGNAQTYTYSATPARQPQNSGTTQHAGPKAYAPALRQQLAAPQALYQQPVLQAQEIPRQRVTSKAATKRKVNGVRPANQRRRAAPARNYRPNYPAQARAVVQPQYGQAPQSGYYMNPYQTQYTTYPNYYQGYYGSWGSSTQACAPGRA